MGELQTRSNDLVLYDGLSFEGYQLGDVVIIKEVDLIRKCPFMRGWRDFHNSLLKVAKVLDLDLKIEHRQSEAEYRIWFEEKNIDYSRERAYITKKATNKQDW